MRLKFVKYLVAKLRKKWDWTIAWVCSSIIMGIVWFTYMLFVFPTLSLIGLVIGTNPIWVPYLLKKLADMLDDYAEWKKEQEK